METTLRPLTLGEILDRTAQLYRTNFLLFAGIAAVYAGVLLLVGLAQTGVQEWMRVEHMYRQLLWMTGVWVLITWIVIFIFGGIAVAANNRAVAWLHLGQPATIRGAYRSILPRFGRYLWLGFLTLIYAWLPVILIYATFIGAAIYMRVKGLLPRAGAAPPVNPGAQGPALLAFGIIVIVLFLLLTPAFLYGIFMWLRYALAVPACVVENLKARAAIRRSVELSKYSRGRIFVLALLVAVIEIGLALVTQSFFVIEAFKHHQQLPVGLRILQQLVGFCTNTFVTPILATGLTLFYYDQRVRKEGYDIEWMMEAAGLTAPAATGLPPVEPAPAESGSIVFAPPQPPSEAGNAHE
ncbi:MAG TPA: hypothetical protein VLZ50_03135 [Terracidiphilus sp.]|nr:hypothetical protein [Terracidiphilus sp.]